MTKTDLINDVVYEMSGTLDREQADRLKITLLVKMHDCEVTQITSLPATVVYDNDWLLQRFMVDGIARGVKESTLKQYIYAVRSLLAETSLNYRMVTGQDITDYLAIRQYRDHISPNYKATLYRYFSSFWQWAYRRQHIAHDIMRDVDAVRSVQKKKERLSDEEIEDIREACNTLKERALFELMMSTGMRVGEIAALNIADLDLQNKRISIWGEKTSRYRTGMLSVRAVKALNACIGARTDGPLFVSDRRPYGRMQTGGLEDDAKGLGVRAGITRVSTTVHVYRKTFASVLYRKTKDVLLVSKLLGHAKTDMTVQYYLVDDIDDMQHTYNVAVG